MISKTAFQGYFKFETFKVDAAGSELEGSRRIVADWFPNLVLDGGLERIGVSADWLARCQVGSGSAPVTPTQTSLTSLLGSTTASVNNVSGAQASSPFFGWRRKTYRFSEGVAAGNVSEVGVGWTSSPAGLFSRALVVDSTGNPTTITVLPDEALDVTYEIRILIPEVDSTGIVTLAGIDHTWICRAAAAADVQVWAPNLNGSIVSFDLSTVYNGAIGSLTGRPSGTSAQISAVTSAYSANSRKRRVTASASLTQGNVSGGIRSIIIHPGSSANIGSFQIEFNPPIPKTSTRVFSLIMETSWGRPS